LGYTLRPALSPAPLLSGTITKIETISTGTTSNDMVLVFGTFTTGCTYSAFVLISSDNYFSQTYAAMLAAKVAGTTIQYDHVYCVTSGASAGYSRGDMYISN
jgi:hypothetical protein